MHGKCDFSGYDLFRLQLLNDSEMHSFLTDILIILSYSQLFKQNGYCN